jgi:hypothetical protein
MPFLPRPRLGGFLVLLALSVACAPRPAAAQLISPGKLSSAHADLEGIRHCTKCHELRKQGISSSLCLDCHEPLARRMEADEGFHASLPDKACATCHKEHFGVDFALVRLDTTTFEHDRTGFGLEGKHAEQGCRDCHKPSLITDADVRAEKGAHDALDRTFLGLPTACVSCHEGDTPHGRQFEGRACSQCHDVGGWDEAARFDHRETRYPLTGKHLDVACTGCHQATDRPGSSVPYVQYTGVTATRCNDCHEDEHDGAMPGACSSCHATSGWTNVNRRRVESAFDHATTGFVLEGRHAAAPCASCHDAGAQKRLEGIRIRFQKGTRNRAFPRPEAGSCLACHEDRHEGVFADVKGAGDCAGCHGQDAWLPADYDAARHNREAPFKLEGAHMAVACVDCHVPDGGVPRFRLQASSCGDCHQEKSPHGNQFEGRSCDECHNVKSFKIPDFDHDATRFPLDGAHAGAPCGACHKTEKGPQGAPMVRYRPLGTDCRDCHGGAS